MQESNLCIYGKNPVKEKLQDEPDAIEKIFVRHSINKGQVQEIFDLASSHKIPVVHVPGTKLYEMVGSVNDQGIVAMISAISYKNFRDWLTEVDDIQHPAVLLLDEIQDPHNLGAILRSAAAAGVHGVIVPKHRQAPVNATVFKTSAGTAGKIPIIRVGNLNQTIQKLKDAGFWIGGLDVSGEQTIWNHPMDMPLAFVIGSEGEGISQKTLEHCDFVLNIPLENGVESLNASVSAALICYEWVRRRRD